MLAPAAAVSGVGLDPFARSKPLAVFVEQNPWLKVIGSDTPGIAVYENVDVISTVNLEGKKWAVSYRYTFPIEPVWRKALWGQ
jgi:hypothetical protein